MEGVQMSNNNTKQSEETKIQWSIMGNPVLSGQSTPETVLTIHPDGRITTSDRLKPDETAALVLDQIKTQWLKDAQATKIRELQDRIRRLEEAGNQLKDRYILENENWDLKTVNDWNEVKEAKP
jgi:hypothetical protein